MILTYTDMIPTHHILTFTDTSVLLLILTVTLYWGGSDGSLLYHTPLKQANKSSSFSYCIIAYIRTTKLYQWSILREAQEPSREGQSIQVWISIWGILGNCWGSSKILEVLRVNVSHSERLKFTAHKVVYEFMISSDITQNEVYQISDVRILVHLSEILEKCSVILY